MCKPKNAAEALALAIKAAEVKKEKRETAPYTTEDSKDGIYLGKAYPTYLSNKDWEAFKDKMEENVRKQYSQGSGSEMEEKNYRPKNKSTGYVYPPKMASYASSSRMIYLLARNNPDFQFEEKLSLPNSIGKAKPNLDGYIERNEVHYYIEAKRAEPYGSTNYGSSLAYKKLYEEYLSYDPSVFRCECPNEKDRDLYKKKPVAFYAKGEKLEHFDIKQVICHLLGIAIEHLKDPEKKMCFIYLLYDPIDVIDNITNSYYRKKIDRIFHRELVEYSHIPFKTLYRSILHFLVKEEKKSGDIDKMVKHFSAKLCTVTQSDVEAGNISKIFGA